MKWGRCLFLAVLATMAVQADELHLRDGTVIVGVYVGGTQKEVYFERTPVGAEVYPLFLVESVKFSATASVPPNASLQDSRPKALAGPVALNGSLAARIKAPAAPIEAPAVPIKWFLALFLPPHPAAQFPHAAH